MDGSTGLLTADYRRRWKKSGASANRVIRDPPLLWLVECFAFSLHYYTSLLEICKVLFQCFLIDNPLTCCPLFVYYVCFDLSACIIICFFIRLCKESRQATAHRIQGRKNPPRWRGGCAGANPPPGRVCAVLLWRNAPGRRQSPLPIPQPSAGTQSPPKQSLPPGYFPAAL